MPDRAEEIARGLIGKIEPLTFDSYVSYDLKPITAEFAAALRAYGDEKLEEAGRLLQMSFPTVLIDSLGAAAKLVRSLKSQPEAQEKP